MSPRRWLIIVALATVIGTNALAAEGEPETAPPVIAVPPPPPGTTPPATGTPGTPPPAPGTPGTPPAATGTPGTPAPGADPAAPTPTGDACVVVLAACSSAINRCEQALMQASDELASALAASTQASASAALSALNRTPDPDESPGGRDQVASIVKGMKPREAAAMVALWDESLGADILARLSPRVSAPVLAAMPPATSARLTARIAERGH